MTDEEMAEEYKESKRHKCFRADVGKIQIDYEAYLNNLKDGFLAGLKAGRPQWHDLRKDKNDLPKVNGQYWVCYEDSVNIGRKGHEMWIFINGKWEHTAKVIAWCELPTFDKE